MPSSRLPGAAIRASTFRTITIQDDHGKAKAYQVRQVLLAIDKLRGIETGEQKEPFDEV